MKTKLAITMIFLFLSSSLYIGCKKYEEGPAMSLRSKKGRVANKWKVDAYLKNGTDMISDYRMATASEIFEMTKAGTTLQLLPTHLHLAVGHIPTMEHGSSLTIRLI